MRLRLTLAALCLMPTLAFALDANIFEKDKPKEDGVKSFTAKVRVVREISDDLEVFFDSDKAKGAYTLPKGMQGYGAALQALEASKKTGAAVTVTADDDKRIQEVKAAPGKPAPSPEDLQKQYDAIFKK